MASKVGVHNHFHLDVGRIWSLCVFGVVITLKDRTFDPHLSSTEVLNILNSESQQLQERICRNEYGDTYVDHIIRTANLTNTTPSMFSNMIWGHYNILKSSFYDIAIQIYDQFTNDKDIPREHSKDISGHMIHFVRRLKVQSCTCRRD
jgi:hypothetical protein